MQLIEPASYSYLATVTTTLQLLHITLQDQVEFQRIPPCPVPHCIQVNCHILARVCNFRSSELMCDQPITKLSGLYVPRRDR